MAESEFEGPIIDKNRGGLGRKNTTTDGIIGLVVGGVTTTEYTTAGGLGTIVKINQLRDLEDLGFDAAYDAANKVILYQGFKRLFFYAPDAVVYLMVVAQGTTQAAMCDKANSYLYKLCNDMSTNRSIKLGGCMLNPITGYTPTYTTGYENDVAAAVAKAQELATDLRGKAIYLDNVMLEGRMQANATVSTLTEFRALASEYVSVVSAQDPDLAALDVMFARHADVYSALGMAAVRKVSECIGSTDINSTNKPEARKGFDTYPLTDVANGFYLNAVLSSGKKFSDLSVPDQAALKTKGIIYAGRFEDLDGFYFNDSHTCIEVTDDYAYIEDNRVWNKAVRLLRSALLPVMKGEVETDATTGFLPPSVVSFYQTKGVKKVRQMTVNSEISGDPIVTILPDQDVVGSGTIDMSLKYSRKGILRRITATVGAINNAAN